MWLELWAWLRQGSSPEVLLSPEDVAELREAEVRVAGEFAVSAPEIIAVAATRLLQRQVPVRGVSGTALAPGVAELRFADGTTVIVRTEHSGDLGKLAVWTMHGPVTLQEFDAAAGRVALTLIHAGHRMRLAGLGVRQPG